MDKANPNGETLHHVLSNGMREVPIESPEMGNDILVPRRAGVVEIHNQALGTLGSGLGAPKPMGLTHRQPTALTNGDPIMRNRVPHNTRAPPVMPEVSPTRPSPQTPTAQAKAGPTQAPPVTKVGPTRAALSPDLEAKVGSRHASPAQETKMGRTKPISSPPESKVSPTKTLRDPALGTVVGPKSPLAPSLEAKVGPTKAPLAPSEAAVGPFKAQVSPSKAKDHRKGSVTSPIQEKGLDKVGSLPGRVQYDAKVGPEKAQAQEKGPIYVDPTTNMGRQKSEPACVSPHESDQVVTKVEAVQEKEGADKFELPRVVSDIDKRSSDYIQRFKDKMARALN
ncbi:hypothetical protein AMTR_s00025p00128210 [Amborella trichopoda]|uniref:Uncharacterized protein n=1 Tax=Amborella trichopoda TaxID=13333 RepID=W1PW97_AMBTC|nr:hypothetical protein AMTR_s00025p00128210 [Amborella trichopoda]